MARRPKLDVRSLFYSSSWKFAREYGSPFPVRDISCGQVKGLGVFDEGNAVYKLLEVEVDQVTNPPHGLHVYVNKKLESS